MQHLFADTVTSAQIINGVIRIRLGMLKPPADSVQAKDLKPEEFAEILLPISGFTDLANTCNKIAADLLDKGLLNRGSTDKKE